MKKKSILLLTFGILVIFAYQFAEAHPGRLDANGGHYNRKTGEYHYHSGGSSGTPSQSIQIPTKGKSVVVEPIGTISNSEWEAKINNYFRSANENVGALECDILIKGRDLNQVEKRRIKNGDGNCCVICGSSRKLEVDHMRALENGGTNDASNLAALCDICHNIKTKYDNSLRRKRNSMCRRKK